MTRGSSVTFTPTSGDLAPTGTWSVYDPSGLLIADDASPNGWNLTGLVEGGQTLTLSCPITATANPGYSLRYADSTQGGVQDYDETFDVLNPDGSSGGSGSASASNSLSGNLSTVNR